MWFQVDENQSPVWVIIPLAASLESKRPANRFHYLTVHLVGNPNRTKRKSSKIQGCFKVRHWLAKYLIHL